MVRHTSKYFGGRSQFNSFTCLGRLSIESSSRHIDVRNVIWLGTSNVGHDLVFEYDASRPDPNQTMPREEYVELMGLLRPRLSERLGVSTNN